MSYPPAPAVQAYHNIWWSAPVLRASWPTQDVAVVDMQRAPCMCTISCEVGDARVIGAVLSAKPAAPSRLLQWPLAATRVAPGLTPRPPPGSPSPLGSHLADPGRTPQGARVSTRRGLLVPSRWRGTDGGDVERAVGPRVAAYGPQPFEHLGRYPHRLPRAHPPITL